MGSESSCFLLLADEAAQMATEIKLRAERKAGQFLAEMKEQNQLQPGRPKEMGHDVPITLKSIGVEPQESKRWQRIAAVPEERFEEYLPKSLACFENLAVFPSVCVSAGRFEGATPAEGSAILENSTSRSLMCTMLWEST